MKLYSYISSIRIKLTVIKERLPKLPCIHIVTLTFLIKYRFNNELSCHFWVRSLNALYFQDAGIPFEVNGVAMHFSGTIGLCLADNLGSHSWGGFMESFSAYRKCRFCMGTPEDIQQKVQIITCNNSCL